MPGMQKLLFLRRKRSTVRPTVAAENVVFMATSPAYVAVPASEKARVESQLKPYHPNHRMKVPSTTMPRLCRAKFAWSSAQRPFPAPRHTAPPRVPLPPVRSTMPEPAKSN